MKKTLLVIFLAAALLCGCTQRTETPAPSPEPTPVSTPEPTPEPTPAPVTVCGTEYAWDTTELDLTGKSGSADELTGSLKELPALQSVDLSDWTLSVPEQTALREALPDVAFRWSVELFGTRYEPDTEYICLDGQTVDLTALETAVPLLPKLTKVDMVGCGFTDEEMYELNRRHEGVRFIWMTRLGSYQQRTDLTYFRVSDTKQQRSGFLSDETLEKELRYFPDLLALDLGHSWGMVSRCDWLQYTPKLQVLILACCNLSDITPIGELKELSYLEIFTNKALTDLTPLSGCTALQDVNISYLPITDLDYLEGLPVSRLWLVGCDVIGDAVVDEYKAAHPEVEVMLVRKSMDVTGFGWRKHDRFYWMRDMFGAQYID